MTPLTITQRVIGLVICAFVFVFGVSIGFLVLNEIVMLLADWLVPQGVISSKAFFISVRVFRLILFAALCWLSVNGCRRLWPHLFTRHEA